MAEIADTGRGIDSTELRRIFEPFTRGESTPAAEGFGIGLTLARGLVDLHGGEIAVRSAGPGRGSTFVVRLPVAQTMTGPRR